MNCIGIIQATVEQSHQSAEVTTKVNFTCRASGYRSDMFTYQWRINQTVIDNATSSNYIIPSVNESEHGMYECVVTNHWNEMEVSALVQLNITSMSTTYICVNVCSIHVYYDNSTHEFGLVTIRSQKSYLSYNLYQQPNRALCYHLPLQHVCNSSFWFQSHLRSSQRIHRCWSMKLLIVL